MTTVTIDASQPRSVKAVYIAAQAGQWAKVRTRDGRKAYGVPSSSNPSRYYLVNTNYCSCPDFARNCAVCKHILAVRLHVALVRGALPAMRKVA